MVKKKQKRVKETDSAYFLKMVMYLIVGSQWLRIESLPEWSVPIPLGLLIGIWFASHDHFKIDRKIEFAVLLVATFVSFWLPVGIVIQI
ncbi:hypothetical protein KC992_04225 [Candidatus Saccharibacteria bacterium]|nr:hypothetical protein [Candidatus Saccharibacteria bacterium]MCA9328231.1 hypothetical protein [Candidatus Saccharibacteria bacterium]